MAKSIHHRMRICCLTARFNSRMCSMHSASKCSTLNFIPKVQAVFSAKIRFIATVALFHIGSVQCRFPASRSHKCVALIPSIFANAFWQTPFTLRHSRTHSPTDSSGFIWAKFFSARSLPTPGSSWLLSCAVRQMEAS